MQDNLTAVTVCQRLVKYGRYSGDEKDTAEELKSIFRELGYDEIVTMPCGTVIGILGPKNTPVKILFDGHIDVTAITGDWSFEPFCGKIQDGKILGRGTTDMKGGLAAAACAVARYSKKNPLKNRIAVSGSVMEEAREGLGLEETLDFLSPEYVIICEPSDLAIMTGQKGRMEIYLTLFGKSAHASTPWMGENSMLTAAKALLALDKIVPPEDERLGAGILVPTDIITEPYPLISTVPERTKIRFDRRTLPGETEASVLEGISDVLHNEGIEKFKLSIVSKNWEVYTGKHYDRKTALASWMLDEGSFLFKSLYQAAEAVLKSKPKINTWLGCTNGSESAGARGIPTIGLGPGRFEQCHIVDEYIDIWQLNCAEAIYRQFLENLV